MARAYAEHWAGATGSASNTKAVNRLQTRRYAADCAGAGEAQRRRHEHCNSRLPAAKPPRLGPGAAGRCDRLGGSRQPEARPGQRL